MEMDTVHGIGGLSTRVKVHCVLRVPPPAGHLDISRSKIFSKDFPAQDQQMPYAFPLCLILSQ